MTIKVACFQLSTETAARDAQEEADRKALAAEEAARKKGGAATDKKSKGGKELSPTPKKSKAKESTSSPVPAGMYWLRATAVPAGTAESTY